MDYYKRYLSIFKTKIYIFITDFRNENNFVFLICKNYNVKK